MSGQTVSIVVEWDNVRLAGATRARRMLDRLVEEIRAQRARRFEVLLVHDGRPGDVDEAKRMLAPTRADIRVLSAPGSDYYELKNAGAREARGELVVFIDCDIVPEPGWLGEMLAPLTDATIDVVAGEPYIEPSGLWGKCLALVSVFPFRDESARPRRTTRFFANSLAFRRDTALAFPFPELAGTSRASCVALSRQLAEANVGVVLNPAARASHPPPAGVRRAARRALVHGRDTVLLARLGLGPAAGSVEGVRRVAGILRSVVGNRQRVALPVVALPLALALAVAYYSLVALGALLANVAPSAARRIAL